MADENWRIEQVNTSAGNERVIVNTTLPMVLPLDTYNYTINTPIVLAPLNASSTLVLSASENLGRLKLHIHDLRVVDGAIVSSIAFEIRGSHHQLSKFKNEMNRVCDIHRCVGISFLLRKLFYAGFSTLYNPKILHRKQNSTLRATINVVSNTVNHSNQDEEQDGI